MVDTVAGLNLTLYLGSFSTLLKGVGTRLGLNLGGCCSICEVINSNSSTLGHTTAGA